MENASVLILHVEHPVKVPTDFFQNERKVRHFAWNIPHKLICIGGIVFIKIEQCRNGNSRIHNVLSVVAGIVPAFGGADGTLFAVDQNLRIGVARCASPFACILGIERGARTLEIEPLECGLRDIFVRTFRDLDRGAENIAVAN